MATSPLAQIPSWDDLDRDYGGYVDSKRNSQPQPTTTPEQRTWGEYGKDLSLSLAQGVSSLGYLPSMAIDKVDEDRFIGDKVNALSDINKNMEAKKSDYSRQRNQDINTKIEQTGDRASAFFGGGNIGMGAKILTEIGGGIYETAANPDMASEMLANQIPQLFALGKVGKISQAVATKVAPRIAKNVGVGTAVAGGSGLQGADVATETYQRIVEQPDELWAKNPEFIRMANEIGVDEAKKNIASEYAMKAGVAGAGVSLLTNALPYARGVERAIVGNGMAGGIGAGIKTALGEGVSEGIEEGAGQLIGNRAVREINPEQSLIEGVGANTGIGGALGGIVGGTLGTIGGNQEPIQQPRTILKDGMIIDTETGEVTLPENFDNKKAKESVDGNLINDISSLQEQSQPIDSGIAIDEPSSFVQPETVSPETVGNDFENGALDISQQDGQVIDNLPSSLRSIVVDSLPQNNKSDSSVSPNNLDESLPRYETSIVDDGIGGFSLRYGTQALPFKTQEEASAFSQVVESSNNPYLTIAKEDLRRWNESIAKNEVISPSQMANARSITAGKERAIAKMMEVYGDENLAPKETQAPQSVAGRVMSSIGIQQVQAKQPSGGIVSRALQRVEQVNAPVEQNNNSVEEIGLLTDKAVSRLSQSKNLPSNLEVGGAYDSETGKTLVAPSAGVETVIHELGHKALQTYAQENGGSPERIDAILDNVYTNETVSKLANRIAQVRGYDMSKIENVREATNEAVADMIVSSLPKNKGYIKGKYGLDISAQQMTAGKTVAQKMFGYLKKAVLGESGGNMTNQEFLNTLGQIKSKMAKTAKIKEERSSEAHERYLFDVINNGRGWEHDTIKEKVTIGSRTIIGQIVGTNNSFSKVFNWVNTQQHKAEKNPVYGSVWKALTTYTNDIQGFAMQAAAQAPNLIPQSNRAWNDIKDLGSMVATLGGNVRAQAKDVNAVSKAVYDGTLNYMRGEDGLIYEAENVGVAGVVWSPQELKNVYRMTDRQIKLYQEYRSAMDYNLSQVGISHISKMVEKYNNNNPLDKTNSDIDLQAKTALSLIDKTFDDAYQIVNQMTMGSEQKKYSIAKIDKEHKRVRGAIVDAHLTTQRLIKRGYAPLKRFGKYAIWASKGNEEPIFTLYESKVERDQVSFEMKKQGYRVNERTLSQLEYKTYEGISPDAVEAWATQMQYTMPEKREALQQFIRMARAQNSFQKHLLERNGVEGYSKDLLRSMSSYISNNARMIAGNFNNTKIEEAYSNLSNFQGDEQDIYRGGEITDEARELIDYVRGMQEDRPEFRYFLYVNYLFGSVAAATLNLTSLPLLTYPVLTKFANDARVLSSITKYAAIAAKSVLGKGYKIDDPVVANIYEAAKDGGSLMPNEYFEFVKLQDGSNNVLKTGLRKTLSIAGAAFGTIESYNRHLTYLAAIDIAKNMSKEQLASEGVSNLQEFGEKMVNVTQGRYTKDSRPNFSRNTAGATVLVFKTWMINYLEVLNRMPPAQRMRMVGMLFLLTGADGLPYMGNIEEILDTIGQKMGYATNMKRFRREALNSVFGNDIGKVVEHGIINPFGADIATRTSMSSPFPALGILKKSEKDKGKEAMELLGVGGSYINNVIAVAGGDKSAETLLPIALANVVKGYKMYRDGQYSDSRGRKIVATTGLDAAIKTVGFMPTKVTEAQQVYNNNLTNKTLYLDKKGEITNLLAQGRNKEAEDIRKSWNTKNPTLKIDRIAVRAVNQRKNSMEATVEDRFEDNTPKSIRNAILK
jgi:hypothetical protein